jgi:hypothetical protein
MKYKNAEKECIDKVQSILGFMGIKATFLSRLSDEEILLERVLSNDNKYHIYIWSDSQGLLTFQSIVFRSVCGSSEKEAGFYQILLLYNTYLNFVSFGMTKTENEKDEDEWDIVITANRNCKEINPAIMHQIVQSFDFAFVEFVPQLKRWANEHDLRFEGKISKLIEEGFQNRLEG